MNSQAITYSTPWARYHIRWDEVERIEIDAQGGAIVFVGKDKRLAAVGPGYWSGKDKPEMLMLIQSKTEEHKIEVQQTQKAVFRLSKNTKVG